MKILHHVAKGATTLVALSALAFATTFVSPTSACAQVTGGNEVPIQIKGYWGGTTDEDESVLGTLTFADEHGKQSRSFGVTYARSYDPPSIGMDIFELAAIKPAYIVYGRANETDAFFAAPDGKPLVVTGIYWQAQGELIIGSVKVASGESGGDAGK